MTKAKAIGLFNLRLNKILKQDRYDNIEELVEIKDKIVALAIQLHEDLEKAEK